MELTNLMRIVQEQVPGKQVTLAHIIANPEPSLYQKMGLDMGVDPKKAAIGVLTVSPAEAAVIAADIASKSSGASLGVVDRCSGTLIITGTISQVSAGFSAVCAYLQNTLGYTVCAMTQT
ncbi:MAG: BMC domain-containing protein [Eubacteriales bacterium]